MTKAKQSLIPIVLKPEVNCLAFEYVKFYLTIRFNYMFSNKKDISTIVCFHSAVYVNEKMLKREAHSDKANSKTVPT